MMQQIRGASKSHNFSQEKKYFLGFLDIMFLDLDKICLHRGNVLAFSCGRGTKKSTKREIISFLSVMS